MLLNNNIKEINFRNTPIAEVYYGGMLVWEKKESVPMPTNILQCTTTDGQPYDVVINGKYPYKDTNYGEWVTINSGEEYEITDELVDFHFNTTTDDKISTINQFPSTSAITRMEELFGYLDNVESIDLRNVDTSNATTMHRMFYNYYYMIDSSKNKLHSIDVSKFDTSKVTDMGDMFYGQNLVRSLDVSKFDTSKVTDMGFMFYGCEKVASLDLSNFDTSNVTRMNHMFSKCQSLTSLDLSNFDTSNVAYMRNMFDTCKSLTSLDLSNFNTSNVTIMEGMFSFCSNLSSLDLSNWDMSKVTNTSIMFSYCYKLTTIYMRNCSESTISKIRSVMPSGCSIVTN